MFLQSLTWYRLSLINFPLLNGNVLKLLMSGMIWLSLIDRMMDRTMEKRTRYSTWGWRWWPILKLCSVLTSSAIFWTEVHAHVYWFHFCLEALKKAFQNIYMYMFLPKSTKMFLLKTVFFSQNQINMTSMKTEIFFFENFSLFQDVLVPYYN